MSLLYKHMDGAHEEEFMGASNDLTHQQIVKGKRTKRQRSSSSASSTTTSSSTTSGHHGGGEEVEKYYGHGSSSPTTSSEVYESTEEEEDMANCLILLAQGEAPSMKVEKNGRLNIDPDFKFVAEKFPPTITKSGFFVYECKTCSRTFPSFQALGGHRASHKKPKPAVVVVEENKKGIFVNNTAVDVVEDCQLNKSCSSDLKGTSLNFHGNGNNSNNNKLGNKIHECSICGSEFMSGQALGGHMRRHRAAAAGGGGNNNTGNHNNSNNQMAAVVGVNVMMMSVDHHDAAAVDGGNDHQHGDHRMMMSRPRNILGLDLNLPAPEDEPHRTESKFPFVPRQQAAALVFSAPALVDCHY